MTVPSSLVGAWRRVGLLVDGVRRVDWCDVLWLQTPDWFADIRLRIDPTLGQPARPAGFARETAFAGTTGWEAPRITWDHVFDANPKPGPDSSALTWGEGIVSEHLTVTAEDKKVSVVEEWLRMADDTTPSRVAVGDHDVRVELGRWAIQLRDERPGGPFVATRYHADTGRWQAVGSITRRSSPNEPVAHEAHD